MQFLVVSESAAAVQSTPLHSTTAMKSIISVLSLLSLHHLQTSQACLCSLLLAEGKFTVEAGCDIRCKSVALCRAVSPTSLLL